MFHYRIRQVRLAEVVIQMTRNLFSSFLQIEREQIPIIGFQEVRQLSPDVGNQVGNFLILES